MANDPLERLSNISLKPMDRARQFRLRLSFAGPNQPSVVDALLDADELMCLLVVLQEMREDYELPMPSNLTREGMTKKPNVKPKKTLQ